jgi:hypothetical protein
MQEGDKAFEIPLIKEVYSEETGDLIDKLQKKVKIIAPSFCEAIVKAMKNNHGFTYDRPPLKKRK